MLGHEEDRWNGSPVARISSVILILCRASSGIKVLLPHESTPAICRVTTPHQAVLPRGRTSRSASKQEQDLLVQHGPRNVRA